MGKVFAFAVALAAASLIPALAFGAYESVTRPADSFASSFFLALMFGSAHSMLLGAPAAVALWLTGFFRPAALFAAGALIGLLPLSIFTVVSPPNYWQSPVLLFASFGLLGALAGLVFYFTFRGLSPNNSFKPMPLRGTA